MDNFVAAWYRQYSLKDDIVKAMENKPPVSDGKKSPDADAMMAIFGTIGDTTWRMFVPSVGLTLLGVWADGQFGTKPWLMLGGIVLGFAGAILLVRKQITGARRHKEGAK